MTNETEKGGSQLKVGCLGAVGIVVGLIVLGSLLGEPDAANEETSFAQTESGSAIASGQQPGVADPADSLTGPQRNALRTAESYIAMSGFSREGLINQLSSDAGEGYERADAVVAVDNLVVDWNEQAVRSAQDYLNMTGFSCNGLIEQLSSSAGEGYTESEARHGAQQAGAC